MPTSMRPEPQVKRSTLSPMPGVSLYEAIYPPGFRMPRHDHPFSNISLVLHGMMEEWVGPLGHSGEPFQLVYKPAGTVHRDDFGKSGARVFTIAFHDACGRDGSPGASRIRSYRWELGGPALALMLRAWREYRNPDAASPLAIESVVLELLDMGRPADAPAPGADLRGPTPPWLRRALDVLHARFDENIRARDVAEAAGVHPVYLARVFRRRLRCTLGEYLRWLRLAHALGRMRDERVSLAAIAAEAGFYDQPHFTRVFREALGASPSKFREPVRA